MEQTCIYNLIKRYQSRPPLSFYNTAQDPYEMNDLAGDPKYADQINIMKKELLSWMKVEGDPGVELDTPEAHQAAKEGKHLF